MKSKKSFSFEPVSTEAAEIVNIPIPATAFLPEWYKEMEKIDQPRRMENGHLQLTVKSCMPYFDAITAGYMLTTWSEIRFEDMGDGTVNYEMGSAPQVFAMRNKHSAPIPSEYHEVEFAWQIHWQIHTPLGNSTLFMHPLNREDLPFHTSSGIMDTDQNMFIGVGSLPFYVKKGFTGVIPIGTPFAQLVPFQRDLWESEVMQLDEKSHDVRKHRLHKYLGGGYRKEIRQHKSWK